MQIKAIWNITSHLSEWLLAKRTQRINVRKDVEKRDCWWECKLVLPLWKRLWMDVPQKIENRTITWPSNSTYGYISEKKKTPLIWKDTYTHMYKYDDAYSIIYNCQWKQLKDLQTNEQIEKMWSMCVCVYSTIYI